MVKLGEKVESTSVFALGLEIEAACANLVSRATSNVPLQGEVSKACV